MAQLAILLSLLASAAVGWPEPRTHTIHIGNGLHRGTWGTSEFCPHDTSIVAAFQIKTADGMGMSGMRIYCYYPDGHLDAFIASSQSHGSYHNVVHCPGSHYITGTHAYVLPDQGAFHDDKGVINVEMKCSDGTVLNGNNRGVEADSRRGHASWGAWVYCQAGHRVCGIQTRVDRDGAVTDDAGLTDYNLHCCPI